MFNKCVKTKPTYPPKKLQKLSVKWYSMGTDGEEAQIKKKKSEGGGVNISWIWLGAKKMLTLTFFLFFPPLFI